MIFSSLRVCSTEMIGDDRPYFIGPTDDVQFDQVMGDEAQIDL